MSISFSPADIVRSIYRYISNNTKIAAEGAWALTGQLLSAMGLLVGMRILSSFVLPVDFGVATLLMSASTLSTALFCQPIMQAVLRFHPVFLSNNKLSELYSTVGYLLKIAVIVMCCLLLFVGVLSHYLLNTSYVNFIIIAGLIIIDTQKSVILNVSLAMRDQRLYAFWVAAEAWLKPLCAIFAVILFNSSSISVLFGYLVGTTLTYSIFYRFSDRTLLMNYKMVNFKLNYEIYQTIKNYALPLMPMALIGWISGVGDRYIIGGMIGASQVGIYSATYGLISRPFLMAGSVVEQTLRPVYFEAVSKIDTNKTRRSFKYLLFITTSLSFLLLFISFFFRDLIMRVFLSEQYHAGTELIPWIALGYFFLTMSYCFEKTLYAYGKTITIFKLQSISATLSIIFAMIGVYHWGIMGAAMSIPVYFGIQLVITMYASQKHAEFDKVEGKK